MGNAVPQHFERPSAGLVVGTLFAESGLADAVGLDNSVRAVMRAGAIEPWSAKDLVKEKLQRQTALARASPLRHVEVRDGMRIFREHVGIFDGRLSKPEFIKACRRMCDRLHIRGVGGAQEDAILAEVFDSMDFDGNGMLSMGEWASGLCTFFKGTQAECVRCVFNLLDSDGNNTLGSAELRAFLAPFVKIMTPREADALRPLLLKKATEDILRDIDAGEDGSVSADEMMRWVYAGNNIVDWLTMVIEKEVYEVYLRSQCPYSLQKALW